MGGGARRAPPATPPRAQKPWRAAPGDTAMTSHVPDPAARGEMLVRLARAHDAKEVAAILAEPFFEAMEWRPLGGSTANYGIVHSQQSDPVNALCEKPINSMDHVLLKACRLAGDDPEGRGAPRTMRKAVEKYLGVRGGDFDALPAERADEMARSVMIIADGPRERPNIAVADRGEGQRPEDFEVTLLSLQRGNKNAIRFVQGKYNMGGTGVLPFCASGYELIASRRCAELAAAEGGSGEWGFTLVREKPDVPEGSKTTWYEFLAVPGGAVPTAPAGPLPLLPAGGALEDGCYIKMFGYDLPEPSPITTSLWRAINSRLYAPSMPVMMVEARECFGPRDKARRAGTVMRGNRGRVARDGRDHVHQRREIQFKLRGFGRHLVEVTVFRHAEMPGGGGGEGGGGVARGSRVAKFRTKSEAVMLTQNGQTHATITEARLKSATGLESLAPYMMVHVDLTAIPTTKAKIFMASRDRVRRSADYKALEEAIMQDLGADDRLRALDAEYKALDRASSIGDESMDRAIVNAVRRNHYIAELLDAGRTAVDGGQGGGKGGGNGNGNGGEGGNGNGGEGGNGNGGDPPPFVPSYVPTYLRMRGTAATATAGQDAVPAKQIPHDGGTSYVYLETDAPNDYTTRETDAGELAAEFPSAADGSCHPPHEGVIRVKVKSKGAQFGGAGDLVVALTRPNAAALRCMVQLYYGEPKDVGGGGEGDDKGGPGEDPEKESSVKVPELRWLARDKWGGQEWDEKSVSKVNSDAILINADCSYLAEFTRIHPDLDAEEIKHRFGFSVYVASLFLHSDLSGTEDYEESFERAIAAVAKSCLPASYDFVLPGIGRAAGAVGAAIAEGGGRGSTT